MRKKVSFEVEEHTYAELKIRLFYDKLKQGLFLRELLEMYIRQDPDMCKVIDKIKTNNKTMGKLRRSRSMLEIQAGRKLEKDFGLSDKERESIYDMIESYKEEEDF